jgi:ketosteroid isomerase-like protein
LLVVGVLSVTATFTKAQPPPKVALEIRSYTLKPGARATFHQRFITDSLPLLKRWGIDVVAYGPSQHDDVSYYLMRAFPSRSERDRVEAAFYASAEWQNGPRAAVLEAIDTYTTILIDVDESTLGGLRHAMETSATTTDYARLLQLNADYIKAVQASDVRRFTEILAPDFLCTLPDGTLIDRAQFLERTAAPTPLRDLEAHDVQVRIMGDVAIVHARTTFSIGGRQSNGRYTDVWARRGGAWLAVAAHVTRN